MRSEIPLQYDLFTGALVDTRSDYQRRLDREREQPRQQAMFPVNEVVQFGQHARPWLAHAPCAPLTLTMQDVRTEEEQERERMRAAEAATQPLFAEHSSTEAPTEKMANMVVAEAETDDAVSLFHVRKATLLEARPDLAVEISGFTQGEIDAIAQQAEAALRPLYMLVLQLTLTNYMIQKLAAARVDNTKGSLTNPTLIPQSDSHAQTPATKGCS